MTSTLAKIALAFFSLAAASAHAAEHFGVDLKTKGFEDVVVLDDATFNIVAGGDDGTAAAHIVAAIENARLNPANQAPPSLTQRVLARYMPHYNSALNNLPPTPSSEIQSLLIKRKTDVIAAKRFLMSLRIEPLLDPEAKNVGGGRPPVVRDSMSRYVLRMVFNGNGSVAFWEKDSQTKEVSFIQCRRITEDAYSQFAGNSGRTHNCLGISDWKGLNLPVGVFVSDLTKFGDLGLTSDFSGQRAVSTLRAGVLVTADGRAGTAGASTQRQGRMFVSHSLVIWDSATGEVAAGPFDLEKKSPDVLYATNNCAKTTNGLSVVDDPAGNCSTLNPTLGAGWTYDAPLF